MGFKGETSKQHVALDRIVALIDIKKRLPVGTHEFKFEFTLPDKIS